MAVFNVMMIGDIVGNSGLKALSERLPLLIDENKADLVIVNGENSSNGFGLTKECSDIIYKAGADVITSGNHIWEKKEIDELLESDPNLLRPANYPPCNKGHGFVSFEKNNRKCLVLNLQGRESMIPIDSPFTVADDILSNVEKGTVVVVDFHAESFPEKEALGMYLDGRVSAFAGTHTHVLTADERILPQGSGYIGDLGMTGPENSVIGVGVDICLQRNISQMPIKMETSTNPSHVSGAIFSIDENGKCISISRIIS